MKIQRIKLDQLLPNTGQIPGLPINPRQWTKSDIDKIAASLKETPELFEARPIIAVPFDGRYVILGGNLRYEGARQNKDADAPVVVLPANLPVEKMKEIVIKDNGSFGAWDIDALANEWDAEKLDAWGVPEWVTGGGGMANLPDLSLETVPAHGASGTGFNQLSLVFKSEDYEIVDAWIKEHGKDELIARIIELCQPAEAK